MATIYWKGTSTNPILQSSWSDHISTGAQISDVNWDSGDLSAHDVIVGQYGNGALTSAVLTYDLADATNTLAKSFKSLTIIERSDAHSSYSDSIPVKFAVASTSLTLGVGGLVIKKANCIWATHATTIKFTGAVNSDKTYITFDSTIDTDLNTAEDGMFRSGTRELITFKFEPGTNINLELADGVYPNLEGVSGANTCTLSPTAPLSSASVITYGYVDILNLVLDDDFKLNPTRQTEADFDKIFRLEGNLHINNDTFFWGNSTVEFTPVHAISSFPVTGVYKTSTNYIFGNDTTKVFNAKYNKIVINYAASKYFALPASSILMCNHINITSGGRLYGPNTTVIEGAEIHSIQRPTIEGDWNFTQVADGVYRTRKTLLPQQEYHDVLSSNRTSLLAGTTGKVLSISSAGKLEWSATAGGTSRTVAVDTNGDGSANETLGASETLTLKKGTNITLAESGGVVTISSTDTNTVYTHPTTAGNKHIPAGGASGNFLKYDSAGTAVWATPSYTTNTDVDVSVANLETRLAGGFDSNTVTIGDSDDVVTIGNDLVVAGDLTVSGDTVTANVSTISVEDPLIELSRNQANNADTLDIGFFGKYGVGGTHKYAGLFRDANDSGKFKLFKDSQEDLTSVTVINTSATGYAVGTLVANLEGTATLASTVTLASDNEDASHYVTFADAATGSQALKTDDQLVFNPSSGRLTANVFVGALAGDATGLSATLAIASGGTGATNSNTWLNSRITTNADGSLNYDATSATAVNHDSLAGFVAAEHVDWAGASAGTIHSTNIPTLNQSTSGTAALATTVTIVDNAETDETVYPVFVDGATGTQGLETETKLSYKPDTGILTSIGFAGALTGNVTGNASGTAATVTGATQSAITTVGDAFTIGSGTSQSATLNLTAGNTDGSPAGRVFINMAGNEGRAMGTTFTDSTYSGEEWFAGMRYSGAFNEYIIGYDEAGSQSEYAANTQLTINSNGSVTADTFVGALTGNVTGNVSGSSGSTTGNAATATTATYANAMNGIDDRDMAPQDIPDTTDFQIFFTTKEGLEDGTSTSGNYMDAIYLSSYADHSGHDANLLAFDKSTKAIYHYQADQDATNWGTAKQLAYTDSDITGNAATATLATTVTVTDNESTGEENLISFVAGAATATGAQNLEMDGHLSYNPSYGRVTATKFKSMETATSPNQGLAISHTVTSTDDNLSKAATIDLLQTGIVASGKTSTLVGLDINLDLEYDPSSAIAHVGTIIGTGADITVVGEANGTSKAVALTLSASGTDTNYGLIVSAGNVGIGITAPVPLLHVYGNSTETTFSDAGAVGMTIEQDGDGDAALSFLLTGIRRWLVGVDHSDADKFKISTGDTNLQTGTKLTIDSDGNVGIGTATPSAKLDVDEVADGIGLRVRRNDSSTSVPLVKFIDDSTGNDGPSVLEIQNDVTDGLQPSLMISGGSISLKEQADAPGDTAAYGQLWVKTATPNELYFTTDAGNDIQLTSGTAAGDADTAHLGVAQSFTAHKTFTDDTQAIFGTGSDLKIYHDGSNSYIDEEGTGSLIINSSQVAIKGGADAAENMATFVDDGAVTLYHNNEAKFATTSTGVTILDGTLDYGSGKLQSSNIAVGWYTVAYVAGRDEVGGYQRAFGEFLINCIASSRHGTVRFNATHFFGAGESIQAFAYNFYSTPSFTKLRIKSGGTYSGAAVQVYVSDATNDLESYMTMTEHNKSWLLLDTWLLDTESAGAHDALVGYGTDAWTNFAVAEELDLSVFTASSQGGIYTTGGLKAEEIRLGKAGTNSYLYLSPDTNNSFILASGSGTDVTLAADDDLVLHADDDLFLQAGGATKVTVLDSGNVGIGTTAPDHLLHVVSSGNAEIEVERTSGAAILLQAQSATGVIGTSSNHDLAIKTNGSTRIQVENGGDVGIGTTEPDAKLHVEGSVLIDAYTEGAGAGLFFREGHLNTNQPSITVQDHNGANPDGLAISAYDGISFKLNAVEIARFDTAGNLGIGDTTPTYKLDVNGTLRATGNITGDSNITAAGYLTSNVGDGAFSVLETGAIFEGVSPETDTTAFTLHNGSLSSITYSSHYVNSSATSAGDVIQLFSVNTCDSNDLQIQSWETQIVIVDDTNNFSRVLKVLCLNVGAGGTTHYDIISDIDSSNGKFPFKITHSAIQNSKQYPTLNITSTNAVDADALNIKWHMVGLVANAIAG